MGTVTEGKFGPQPREFNGEFKCFHCGWQAIKSYALMGPATGTEVIQCDDCERDAVRIGVLVSKGDQWQCNCGCFVFHIATSGPYCVHCGTTATGWMI